MAQEEMLVLLGHVWQCSACQTKLLTQSAKALVGQRLSEADKKTLQKLTEKDFSSLNALAEATGTTTTQLYDAMNHPRSRLRHL